jgi:hypothetical protein
LKRISDPSFQAAHPIRLAPNTIALVLRGVLVRSDEEIPHGLKVGKPEVLRAFTDDTVAYLAPLISESLSRAASDQEIGFRVLQTGTPGYPQSIGAGVGSFEPSVKLAPSESTSGTVYAYGRSLYFTLTQYQHRPDPAATVNMASGRIPNSTGFANDTVMFAPESARRDDSYRPAHSTPSALGIDYEILAALQPESGSPASVQAAPTPTARRPNSPVKPDPA